MRQELQEIMAEEREKIEEERRVERENMHQELQQRIEKERENTTKDIISRGLQNGMSPEQFVSLLGISLEEVAKVQESVL